MQVFQDLGSLIERRWRDEDYCEEIFPEIAERALLEMTPRRQVSPWDIIRWVGTSTELPQQQDVGGAFGNPPITLYNGPGFYIDVYYWLDGTTSIHQHSFSGAFQVFSGSSLHSLYEFEEKRRVNAHFSVGQIALNSVELLKEGDVRQIVPGRPHIHSLFHLDRPSVTITIRTRSTPSAQPQYDYHKPYFAVDPFYQSPIMFKKLQSVSFLLGMNHSEADDLIAEMLLCSDFQTAFEMIEILFNRLPNNQLEAAFGLSTGKERFDRLLEIARHRHGEFVDLILPVFEEVQRQNHIIHRRGQITGSEHRFFLALLLNVPDRIKVLELVKERFPDNNPVNTIMDWVEELANTKVAGSSEPNVLGIQDFDDYYLFVFQCLLEGLALEELKSAFEEEFSAEHAGSLENKPEALYNRIRSSMLFRSIFPDGQRTATARHAMTN
ncbi:MAG: hypothetical protein WBV94_29545 [Blastocatellia bacterium]